MTASAMRVRMQYVVMMATASEPYGVGHMSSAGSGRESTASILGREGSE